MPVQDGLFGFQVNTYYMNLYVKPLNGSTASLYINTNISQDGSVQNLQTGIKLNLNEWYLLEVAQGSTRFDIYCYSFNDVLQNGTKANSNYVRISNNKQITTTANFGLYQQGTYMCQINVGGSAMGAGLSNSLFQFDLAWIHFYDYYIGPDDVVKDCKVTWQFTDFPSALNTYTS